MSARRAETRLLSRGSVHASRPFLGARPKNCHREDCRGGCSSLDTNSTADGAIDLLTLNALMAGYVPSVGLEPLGFDGNGCRTFRDLVFSSDLADPVRGRARVRP